MSILIYVTRNNPVILSENWWCILFAELVAGNDPGAKVSLFMHGWRQLVMFQEQK